MGDRIKTTVEQEKTTAEKLAFNNAAVEAISANAKKRDETRKKNQEIAAQYAARRRANRKGAGGDLDTRSGKLQGLAKLKNTLGRQFIGADPYDLS